MATQDSVQNSQRDSNRSGASLLGVMLAPMLAGFPMTLLAQSTSESANEQIIEEVIVTARRKDETLQEVPLSVNAVSSEKIADLNIRKLEDISSVVAGLSMQEDTIAPNASVRGVRFDTFASGNNPTVEFYMNDSPIVSLSAMQAMFDIGQIEVLRGPQGTLRGRASPSGAITLTTKRPDLQKMEGYIDLTATDIGGQNARFAVGSPLIDDVLAVRLAGFYEQNEGNRVESINSDEDPLYEGGGARISLRYAPNEKLEANLMYQRIKPRRRLFTQVESANRADPSQPAPAQGDFDAGDRKAVSDIATESRHDLRRLGFELGWEVGGLMLNYAGSSTDMMVNWKDADDSGDVFGPGSDPRLQDYGQVTDTETNGHSHEFRLSPSELINDKFSYVVGVLYQENESDTELMRPTPVFLPSFAGGGLATVVQTPVTSQGESTEQSVFANVTWMLNEKSELSGGLRYIDYQTENQVRVSGATISDTDEDWTETIYSLSYKHHYSDDLMAYATAGSSWRPGINVVGNFSRNKSARERQFESLDPETSDSIEFGAKSTLLDGRMQLNGALYYQTFDNYPYRAGGEGVYYVETDSSGTRSVKQHSFVAAVPVDVYGLEVETRYQVSSVWSVGALFSYAKGEIDGGTVPCNDYAPADGQPDSSGSAPTVAQIDAATGGQNVGACDVDYRSNYAPLWTTTLSSEYGFEVAGLNAYVRGLWTVYGSSKNDPTNAFDNVDSYNILNLYTGVRGSEGKWEAMLYAKNIADEEEVLSRGATPAGVGVQVLQPPSFTSASGETRSSTYREISVTPEREIGLNFRYNF
ncbi:TonB-dependent receptor [Litorivivens sp.]|uniref:TonB-dependent receptor n=2 Tax=Litorivivens sp. TaxID=2020868 RepID=UPI003566F542